ncbi:MAG TPA: ankyrin repeat domain-containing protein [Thermoanaerobaculia bacterium]|nr:ankyrin repeat domain-containing protein [Thermoanaerobaculia bacterium]
MLAIILTALLTADAKPARSEVTKALFTLVNGEAFIDPKKNEALQAILARHPQLDLYETAALGTSEQLEAMLRDDPDGVRRPNNFGWTALHMSAFAGNVANSELLIRKGAEVNVRAKSRFLNTPLQTALLSGQYDTARLLIEHGADVLVRQAKGFTPMHEAALLGRADIIELLLAHGAEINSMADNGHTPLAEAYRGHHDEAAALLKSKGAKVEPTPDEEIQSKKKP